MLKSLQMDFELGTSVLKVVFAKAQCLWAPFLFLVGIEPLANVRALRNLLLLCKALTYQMVKSYFITMVMQTTLLSILDNPYYCHTIWTTTIIKVLLMSTPSILQ
jgi:hypothetical protein